MSEFDFNSNDGDFYLGKVYGLPQWEWYVVRLLVLGYTVLSVVVIQFLSFSFSRPIEE